MPLSRRTRWPGAVFRVPPGCTSTPRSRLNRSPEAAILPIHRQTICESHRTAHPQQLIHGNLFYCGSTRSFSPVRAQHPAAAEAYPSPVSNFRHPIGRIPSGRAEPPSPTSPTPNASFRASARRSIPLGAEGKVDDDAARSDSGSSSSTAASPTGTPRIAALPLSSDAQQAADAASTAAAVSGGGTAQAARTPGQYRSLKGKLRETRRVLQDVLREHEKMRRQLRRRRRESLQADEELRLRKLRIQELDARVEKDVRVITFYERERTEVAVCAHSCTHVACVLICSIGKDAATATLLNLAMIHLVTLAARVMRPAEGQIMNTY